MISGTLASNDDDGDGDDDAVRRERIEKAGRQTQEMARRPGRTTKNTFIAPLRRRRGALAAGTWDVCTLFPSSVTRSLDKLEAANSRQIVFLKTSRYRLTDLGSRQIREHLADKLLLQ
jgi:hypothetical protein